MRGINRTHVLKALLSLKQGGPTMFRKKSSLMNIGITSQ